MISEALVGAEEPLIITGYTGRNHATVPILVKLADTIKGLRVLDTGGSDMCFPADHRAWLGLRYGSDESVRTADVILVIDCGMFASSSQFHLLTETQMSPGLTLSANPRNLLESTTLMSTR